MKRKETDHPNPLREGEVNVSYPENLIKCVVFPASEPLQAEI